MPEMERIVDLLPDTSHSCMDQEGARICNVPIVIYQST
jgi:hypothetical protein